MHITVVVVQTVEGNKRVCYLECLTKTSSSSSGPLSGLLNLTLVNNLR